MRNEFFYRFVHILAAFLMMSLEEGRNSFAFSDNAEEVAVYKKTLADTTLKRPVIGL